MKPYKSLGIHTFPSYWKAWQIGRALTRITRANGLRPLPGIGGKVNKGAAWNRDRLHAEVRLSCNPKAEGASWHQDGDNTSGANMSHQLVLWADRMPTQFRVGGCSSNGEYAVYQAKPNELVVIDNVSCLHRRPPEAKGFRRSFRQRCLL
jgi:hypothetical protein